MPVVTLPDGSKRTFDHPVTVQEVAANIGAGLAKATLAGKVDGKLVDTSYRIETDVGLVIITEKSPEAIEIFRHSTAHLLAQAVKQLYPEAQVTIGPTVENGFYYDFRYAKGFTEDDLARIQTRMEEIAKQDIKVERSTLSREDAIRFFRELGEEFKARIIEDIPVGETLSLYRQGDFIDLCRGPHVPSTGKIKAFKLTKVAGAYWRGDAKNEMLQRIYGVGFIDKKELDAYLHQLEEAEKRDHRKIGKQMDLFHMEELAPGMVFWHDKGWTIYQQIEQYIRNVVKQHGYQEVRTPVVVGRSLWERSGHWEKFHENMFTTHSEERDYAVKPMNCPCHVLIFNQGLKSYRDLPLRMAEFGSCHRNESSGSLHGIMRVRGFTQDDAHIFCTEEQIQSEVSNFIDLLYKVYADFGFTEVIIKLSTRPAKRVGTDAQWDMAEHALETALNAKGLPWDFQPGEGAFYGPKIEFSLKDCIGRVWQCGTIQVDPNTPERLGAEYVAEDNTRKAPFMLHRAILGSLERFIGILIEHHAGILPLWLAPVQVVVMNITDKQGDFTAQAVERLKKHGLRVISDLRNEKIGFKIREHTLQRVPYLLVAGDREVAADALAVRTRGGQDLGTMSVEDIIRKLTTEVDMRGQ